MSAANETSTIEPGRPVRLVPTPVGFWRLVLGLCITTLAPLFGFLYGSMRGADPDAAMPPMYWGLFIGFVIGGLGLAMAIVGAWKLWTASRRGSDLEEAIE
jgi:uncharacterized membrane protein